MIVLVCIVAATLLTSSVSELAPEHQATKISPDSQTLIDADLKDVDVTDIFRLVAELGQFNLVADPSVQCRLTLNLKAVAWRELMETALKSCKLGEEWMGPNLVRVVPLRQLAKELEERRKYEEQKSRAGARHITYRKLAYARAKDIAPLIQKFLSPRGEVFFDERTNTLIITDVAR